MVRSVELSDANWIAAIYNHYVATSTASFETEPVSTEEMRRRISSVLNTYPYLVYQAGGEVHGYAYLHHWNERQAYGRTAECSVYVHPDRTGRGIGSQLYEQLFGAGREMGLHAIIAGISLPNPASVRLHERFGFEKVAQFRETGFKFGHWIDVACWELLLDSGSLSRHLVDTTTVKRRTK